MNCKFNLNKAECNMVCDIIKKYYRSYDNCFSCNIIDGLIFLLTKWDVLKKKEKEKIKLIFKALGYSDDENINNISFICPQINKNICVPCRLNKCAFFVDYKWSNNCILAYLLKQKKISLEIEELSYLLRLPLNCIQKTYNTAINRIQRKMLNDSIDAPRFIYYKTDKLCCVCECNIEKYLARSGQLFLHNNLVIESLGLVYCSDACKRIKPFSLIALEIEFETNIFYILKKALYLYKHDMKKIAEVLNLSPSVLRHACTRYLVPSEKTA